MSHLFEFSFSNPLTWIGTHLLTVGGFGLCVFLVARLFQEHRPAPVTLAWLLAILLIPYVGVPLYFLFGGRKLRGVVNQKPALYPRSRREPHQGKMVTATERVLASAGMPPAREGNRVEFLCDGQAAYNTIFSLIDGAERSIHLMTFILGHDHTGHSIIDLLAKKAAAGVEVKLLLDALGCFRTSGSFVDPVRRAGGKVGIFMPVLPLRRKWSANLRNHRKVLIVDDDTGVVGGMNLANEYLGPNPDPTRWIDTGAVIQGPAARDLDRLFANDWNFATDDTLSCDEPGDECRDTRIRRAADGQLVQIAASGPDTRYDAIYEAMLTALMEARERIWIVTPYFIPDETLYKVLALQSRMGTDVRIIVPAESNHMLADFARERFLRDLCAEGAKIHAFPHMMHAKLMLFDHKLAALGSANFDTRSLYLNFEVTAMLYSEPAIATIAKWMQDRIAESREHARESVSMARGLAETLSGLVAPLL